MMKMMNCFLTTNKQQGFFFHRYVKNKPTKCQNMLMFDLFPLSPVGEKQVITPCKATAAARGKENRNMP